MPVMHVDLQVTYSMLLTWRNSLLTLGFARYMTPASSTHVLLLSILPNLTSYFVAVVIITATRGRHLTT